MGQMMLLLRSHSSRMEQSQMARSGRVNGASTCPGRSLDEDDASRANDFDGRSGS